MTLAARRDKPIRGYHGAPDPATRLTYRDVVFRAPFDDPNTPRARDFVSGIRATYTTAAGGTISVGGSTRGLSLRVNNPVSATGGPNLEWALPVPRTFTTLSVALFASFNPAHSSNDYKEIVTWPGTRPVVLSYNPALSNLKVQGGGAAGLLTLTADEVAEFHSFGLSLAVHIGAPFLALSVNGVVRLFIGGVSSVLVTAPLKLLGNSGNKARTKFSGAISYLEMHETYFRDGALELFRSDPFRFYRGDQSDVLEVILLSLIDAVAEIAIAAVPGLVVTRGAILPEDLTADELPHLFMAPGPAFETVALAAHQQERRTYTIPMGLVTRGETQEATLDKLDAIREGIRADRTIGGRVQSAFIKELDLIERVGVSERFGALVLEAVEERD